MKVIRSTQEIRHVLALYAKENIALVPTMGCLHEGHLDLIRQAKRLADIVVVSIYVNPLQFGQNEDLDIYPRPFAQDSQLCEAEGVDILFHPQQLYPEHGLQVGLHVNDLHRQLCGQTRQGHFDGVVTVVNILFNLIQPQMAIFGEKDFQQLTIIRRMVADLHMPIDIIEAATVREADGLAKSSRHVYLSAQERKQAAALPVAMEQMLQAVQQGENLPQVLALGQAHLAAAQIQVEYISINDEHDLLPIQDFQGQDNMRIFIAAHIGNTRLIDNQAIPFAPTNTDSPEDHPSCD